MPIPGRLPPLTRAPQTSLVVATKPTVNTITDASPNDSFTRVGKQRAVLRGPEDPAMPGDIVRSPAIPFSAETALAEYDVLLSEGQDVMTALLSAPYPSDPRGQLRWALARAPWFPEAIPNDWSTASNDSRSELVAYARGLAWGRSLGMALDSALEQQVETTIAEVSALPFQIQQATADAPMPQTLPEALRWAAAQANVSWNGFNQAKDFTEQAVYLLVAGVRAKAAAKDSNTPIVSERRTIEIAGDTRVYAIHTPPGPMPLGGWPTIMMFHGSYGGNAPEQQESYQQLNAIADTRGYQVIYPVGLPQDRADTTTGQGMLNWDPVGAGVGGANDELVLAIVNKLAADGVLNRSQLLAAGHSQGGFYVSGLIASHPDLFKAAAIFGAGAGTVASATDFSQLGRRTPLLLHVGEDDIHITVADELAAKLTREGFGALTFDRPAGRGHEVLPVDYERFFDFCVTL